MYDAKVSFLDEPDTYYVRLVDCLYTVDDAHAELEHTGFTPSEAAEYVALLPVDREHELDRLDVVLGLDIGTSKSVLLNHADPSVMNVALERHGIRLAQFGRVIADQRPAWVQLLKSAGVSSRYYCLMGLTDA